MMTKQQKKYGISVDDSDTKCLTLLGQEYWPDDFASDAKSIGEIIINAANYSPQASGPNGYHYTYFDRPLWVEPRHPNPDLSR